MDTIWQAAIVGLWLAFIVQCLFILALFRYLGELINRIPRPELKAHRPAPVTSVTDVRGEQFTFGKPTRRPRLLLFIAPGCPACERLAGELPELFRRHHARLECFVICDADEDAPAVEHYAHQLELSAGLARLIVSRDLVSNYHVQGTPFAALLDEEGIVRHVAFVNQAAALERAIERVTGARKPTEAPTTTAVSAADAPRHTLAAQADEPRA